MAKCPLTCDAQEGYLQLATDEDMVRNLLISPYLVNRSLPGAETRQRIQRVSGEPAAPALIPRRASSDSKSEGTLEGQANASDPRYGGCRWSHCRWGNRERQTPSRAAVTSLAGNRPKPLFFNHLRLFSKGVGLFKIRR